jgi:hypothetical protein
MKEVPFEEVQSAYLTVKKNMYQQWAVNKTNQQANNQWYLAELTRDEAMQIILPHHRHSTWSKRALIHQQGSTASQVLEQLPPKGDYDKTNKRCWRSIEYLKTSTTPIIVSTEPIATFVYWNLAKHEKPCLYHVDGLHRLLAFCLRDDADKIMAYIAGDNS